MGVPLRRLPLLVDRECFRLVALTVRFDDREADDRRDDSDALRLLVLDADLLRGSLDAFDLRSRLPGPTRRCRVSVAKQVLELLLEFASFTLLLSFISALTVCFCSSAHELSLLPCAEDPELSESTFLSTEDCVRLPGGQNFPSDSLDLVTIVFDWPSDPDSISFSFVAFILFFTPPAFLIFGEDSFLTFLEPERDFDVR